MPRGLFAAAMAAALASAGVWAQAVMPQQGRDRQAQTPAPATAFIMGTVVIAGTGQPADGVRLTLSGNELRGTRSALTDDSGNFAFLALPPGTYTLRATKTGYVSGTFGQRQPGRPGTPIVLAAGQQLKNVSLEVARGGVIAGTLYNEKNRPAVSIAVRVLQWNWQSGQRVLTSAGTATSDDRGMYRVFGLAPGEYLVNANPKNNSGLASADLAAIERTITVPTAQDDAVSGYAAVYYPGTPLPGAAQTVKVGVSQEQLGIDFQLRRVPLSRVTGTVMVPSGVTASNVQIRLVDASSPVPGLRQFSARPGPQGAFTFTSVPPGQYRVTASVTMPVSRPQMPPGVTMDPAQLQREMEVQMASSGGGRRLWASADATVDGGYTPNVSLSLQEGMTITGSLSFNGPAPVPAQLTRVRLTLAPHGQAMSLSGVSTVAVTANADANGRFTFVGVSPGQYRVRASGAAGWTVKSVMADGRDTLDFWLEVTPGGNVSNVVVEFGDRTTELRGTLQSQAGQPTAEYTVIVFPSDNRYWVPLARRVRSARPSTDGQFSFSGLPPGDYRLAAVTDVEPGAWYDPALLQQLQPVSVAVRLVDGQPVVQDLRVSGG